MCARWYQLWQPFTMQAHACAFQPAVLALKVEQFGVYDHNVVCYRLHRWVRAESVRIERGREVHDALLECGCGHAHRVKLCIVM
jgi:hypothetical protein